MPASAGRLRRTVFTGWFRLLWRLCGNRYKSVGNAFFWHRTNFRKFKMQKSSLVVAKVVNSQNCGRQSGSTAGFAPNGHFVPGWSRALKTWESRPQQACSEYRPSEGCYQGNFARRFHFWYPFVRLRSPPHRFLRNSVADFQPNPAKSSKIRKIYFGAVEVEISKSAIGRAKTY